MSLRSPPLDHVVNTGMDRRMLVVRVGQPGIFQSFDPNTGSAVVQPCLSDTVVQEDGTEITEVLPTVYTVPVVFPGGNGFRITWPIVNGDQCWLSFSDRSLDSWKTNGQVGAPAMTHDHDITDAVAFAGLKAPNGPWTIPTDRMTIGLDNGTQIQIQNGGILLGSGASHPIAFGDSYKTALDNWQTALIAALTGIGATPLTGASLAAVFTAAQTAFDLALAGAQSATVKSV